MKASETLSISVIVPFYKELDLIERAISSVVHQVLMQTIPVDVIIGNDSELAEHEIRAVLSEKSNRITTIVKNLQAKGAGNARNAALDIASGDLIAFLDADDYWNPEKLSQQICLIKEGANFVTGAYQFEGQKKVISPPRRIASTSELLKNLGVGASTVMVRRDFLGGNRFKNFKFSQDTEFLARLAGKTGFIFASTPKIVTIYAPSNRTSNKFQQLLAFRKVVREFQLSAMERAEIYFRYTVRGVVNHYIRR